MKILVTGAAGYIGSNFCEYLLNKGYQVVGIDNFNTYYEPKVKEHNIKDFKDNPNFKLYRIDLLDAAALDNLFINEKIDAVAHIAAWAGVTASWQEPTGYVKNNVEATVTLLEAMKKFDVKNLIFTSSSSVYGNNPSPFIETMNTDLTLAPYPATKKAAEVMLYTYANNYKMNVTVFRVFNPNGPRMRPDLALPLLIKSCLYGSEFKQYWSEEDVQKTGRDYTYLGHLLEAFETAIKNPIPFEIYNLGNSNPATLSQLIQTVEKVTGKKANIKLMPHRQGEMFNTYADISKAKKDLKYNPTTTLEEIVKIYLEWFMKQEDWYKNLEHV